MTRHIFSRALLVLILSGFLASTSSGQEIEIGFRDSLESAILGESRDILIRLPSDYDHSDKFYPVLYRLDGDLDLFTETVGVIHRLAYMEEIIPDMILVMIGNTNRNRDMMPTNTNFFQSEPGAVNFRNFIENELVPHINSTYRTTHIKLLCGQSLSSIFTLYYFLKSPASFDSYIACSAGFPDCEEYFTDLRNDLLKTKQSSTRKIFLTNGLKDSLDPEGKMNEQIINFTEFLGSDENILCEYKIYKDEGHVPYPSLYHGLKFCFE